MLKRMVLAIGRVLGITQPVGHAHQTQDFPIGGGSNIAAAQHQPASKELKVVRSRAPRATKAQSQKTETLCAPTRTKKPSEPGTKQVTPAPQPVSLKLKRKLKAVHKTTVDKLSKQIQKAAQAEHGQGGLRVATPASPILLHAKPAVRAKQARALRTIQAPSQALEQVAAQILMANQSGEHGKRKATAPKTRQPVPLAKTKKPKAVVLTTQAKKGTRSKTSAQTRTDNKSKGNGS